MEKRKYPAARKQAPDWECPICSKTMSVRGKAGHMEKVHGQGYPIKEHNPLPADKRPIVPKRRPLAKADVRKLISNINYLYKNKFNSSSITERRQGMQNCEYVFRQFEIMFNCTPEAALEKFPDLKTGLYRFTFIEPAK